MARFGRRRFMRRRGSAFRWFVPNLWDNGNPTQVNSGTTVADSLNSTDNQAVGVIQGFAPFPGVLTAGGALAGKQLAQLQWWKLYRIVGRMAFVLSLPEDGILMPFGGRITLWWAFCRFDMTEEGIPDEDVIFNLSLRDNQDQKETILAQDVWSTEYPIGTTLDAGFHHLRAPGPLFELIDKAPKRSFRNQQGLYLVTRAAIASYQVNQDAGIPFNIYAHTHLRVLGKFGR